MRKVHPIVAAGLIALAIGAQGWGPRVQAAGAQVAGTPSMMTLSAWYKAAPPFHIVGPVYFVGTEGLGVYLFATEGGHVLLGGAMPGSAAVIKRSMGALGFHADDIRLILLSHGHVENVGTIQELRKESGAMVVAMDRDVGLLATGGVGDLVHASLPWSRYPAITVDREISDGSVVEFGTLALRARLTPGHTRGSTTFVTTVEENGRSYQVAFVDGGIDTGISLDNQAWYPTIIEECRRGMSVLQSLTPDIWLTYHPEEFEFRAKRVRASSDGARAFIDPAGYQRYIADRLAKLDRLSREDRLQ